MSYTGIRGYYLLTQAIKNALLGDINVNTVTEGDLFDIGNNNEQDVLNTQLAVLNKLVQVLRRGDLYSDKYQLDGDANLEPFVDRFENKVAGWTATFDVLVNNDIEIC
jgi:hypothetical protein